MRAACDEFDFDPAPLLTRAAQLAERPGRSLLGITGPPGAGKSTLASLIVEHLGDLAVLVPMDGFHLFQADLEHLGRADRKGAIDTFDGEGYVALVRLLREQPQEAVLAPAFSRRLEEPVAGAVVIAPSARLVVTEGNYLLDTEPPWAALRTLLDEVWYLAPDDAVRVGRLIARHVAFGKPEDEARIWVERSDEVNARRVASTKAAADLVVAPRG